MRGAFPGATGNASGPAFDAVVTSFFIDTGDNVLSTVRAIFDVLAPGGVWVNLGPLDYSRTAAFQLSLQDVLAVAAQMGMSMEVNERQPVSYSRAPQRAMYVERYMAALTVMRKR